MAHGIPASDALAFALLFFGVGVNFLFSPKWGWVFILVGAVYMLVYARKIGATSPLLWALVPIGLAVLGTLVGKRPRLVSALRARLSVQFRRLLEFLKVKAAEETKPSPPAPLLMLQPINYPHPIQGWAYYSLLVRNPHWKSAHVFYGIRGSLELTSPEGVEFAVRTLFRDRAEAEVLDQTPNFTEEITRLDSSCYGVDLVLVVVTRGPVQSKSGVEEGYTCQSYPPNASTEKRITLGQWKCDVALSWAGGGKLEKRFLLGVRPHYPLLIEDPSVQHSETSIQMPSREDADPANDY